MSDRFVIAKGKATQGGFAGGSRKRSPSQEPEVGSDDERESRGTLPKKRKELEDDAGEESGLGGLVTKRSARWSWQQDLYTWKEYPGDVIKKLEDAVARGKKMLALDDERYIDLTKMVQRRFDDPSKQRMVKREEVTVTVAAAAVDSLDGQGGLKHQSLASASSRPSTSSPQKPTSQARKSGGGGRWFWLSDQGWVPYEDSVNDRLEKAFEQKTKRLQIDEHRFVDLELKKQCRRDDESKQRPVKRELEGKQTVDYRSVASPQKPASTSKTSPKLSPRGSHMQARWYWQTDDRVWMPYEKELSDKIEQAFLKKEKEVKVDAQRYIDLDNQIQKRYDNVNRRRLIKRQLVEASSSSPISGQSRPAKQEDDFPEDEPGEVEEEYDYHKDPDYFASRADRRKVYRCGENYVTVDDVPTWFEQASEVRQRRPLKVSKAPNYLVSDTINKKVSLWHGDITTLEIDAIVNAARPSLLGGGGVDGAIHKAAGKGLLRECTQIGGCDVGDAVITHGFRLPANYVIHTVGPLGENKPELTKCYLNAMALVEKHKLNTVAFCCISTGVYGYPAGKAANVALGTIREWLQKDGNHKRIQRVIFCTFLEEDRELYEKLIQFYFPVDPATLPPPVPVASSKQKSQSSSGSQGDRKAADRSSGKEKASTSNHEMVSYGDDPDDF